MADRLPKDWRRQAIIFLLVIAVVGTLELLMIVRYGHKPFDLLSDAQHVSGLHWAVGMFSVLTVWGWVSSAVCAVLAAIFCWQVGRLDFVIAFALVALLATGLAIDDQFTIHDYARGILGVPEQLVQLFHLLFAGFVAVRYFYLWRHGPLLLLLLGVAGCALSLGLDALHDLSPTIAAQIPFLNGIEDTAKWVGAWLLAIYMGSIAIRAMRWAAQSGERAFN